MMILLAAVPFQRAEAATEEEPLVDPAVEDYEEERGAVEPENLEDEEFD